MESVIQTILSILVIDISIGNGQHAPIPLGGMLLGITVQFIAFLQMLNGELGKIKAWRVLIRFSTATLLGFVVSYLAGTLASTTMKDADRATIGFIMAVASVGGWATLLVMYNGVYLPRLKSQNNSENGGVK